MPEFFVSRVVTPDDDPNFKRMKEQYAEQYLLAHQEQIRKSEAEAAAERKAVEAQTSARMKIIGAQGEAEALKIQEAAEAEEMRMKGHTYQQETARQVGLDAMKNGIGGGEGGGVLGSIGDLAGLGVGLAMRSVIGMTKDAVGPLFDAAKPIEQSYPNVTAPVSPSFWDCACGQRGITGKFCPECGAKRPQSETWDCSCGQKGSTGKFCPECGKKRGE